MKNERNWKRNGESGKKIEVKRNMIEFSVADYFDQRLNH